MVDNNKIEVENNPDCLNVQPVVAGEINNESICAGCSEKMTPGAVTVVTSVCDTCCLEFENEMKELSTSTSDEFGASYDEPTEETPDTDSELYNVQTEKWADDDEVLKQDLEKEEFEEMVPLEEFTEEN